MPAILLTGASGFIGWRLLPRLVSAYPDADITAVRGRGEPPSSPGRVTHRSVDLLDGEAVAALVAAVLPDIVIHLAAQSSVAQALASPWPVWQANLFGTLALAEAVKAVRPDAAFVFASTAEVYGSAFASGTPLDETSPLGPANPYARSKAACEFALRDLWSAEGRLVLLRIFNHLGPGQDERFVASAFAAQIARIEAGLLPPVIKVGDLSVERDFGDIRDLIDALMSVVGALDGMGPLSTFNICRGESRPVQALLDGLIALARVKPSVEIDPKRLRPGELRRVSASNAAIEAATGWRPQRELDDTLASLRGYWREQVRSA